MQKLFDEHLLEVDAVPLLVLVLNDVGLLLPTEVVSESELGSDSVL